MGGPYRKSGSSQTRHPRPTSTMSHHGRYNGSNGSSRVGHEELVPLKGGPVEDIPRRRRSLRERCTSTAAISASLIALVLCIIWVLYSFVLGGLGRRGGRGPMGNGGFPDSSGFPLDSNSYPNVESSSLYDELGRYVLRDYDAQPPFSDFLPGLAGYYGKPLYAFFVNRGQGIASFGVKSKDYPMMEFNSANKAYQNTALLGFRTFLQGSRRGNKQRFLVEPFSPLRTRHNQMMGDGEKRPKRHMFIGSNEMQLREIDHVNGVETNVTYFILPEENFGAFVKRTTISNLDKDVALQISMLDGLAVMEPSGGKLDSLLKNMGRTLEGWMGVHQPYNDTIKMPFYRLSTQVNDDASVVVQQAGHWVLSVLEKDDPDLLAIVYDRSKVFGDDTTLLSPVELLTKSIGDIIRGPQYGLAKTSAAFSALDEMTLPPGASLTISTFFGKAASIYDVPVIMRRLTQPGFVQYKVLRSREIIKQVTASVDTKTSNPLLDGYIQQSFLDNSLRGGIPAILGEVDDNIKMMSADEDLRLKVYHIFSRIHGDLERDYNDFEIPPTFFSQGPGNFRDIIQNRRNDIVFNPRIGAFNVKTFLSFIQADAYEPLSVEAVVFSIPSFELCRQIATRAVGEADGHRAQREALTGILNSGPFRPGQLFLLMEEQNIELIMSQQDFIDMVAATADSSPMAVFEKGFWADHFTYYYDLIESYLSIYPEREERLLFDERLPYFFSPASVKPRSEKYVLSLTFDGTSEHVRQLDAVEEDKEKKEYLKQFITKRTGWYGPMADWQHDTSGNVFLSSPIAKLFLVATIKFATRDAYGMGIEYEGGRPGWDDANNGLVGMIGSGMPETYELIVLMEYISSIILKYKRTIEIPAELMTLISAIELQLDRMAKDIPNANLPSEVPGTHFRYWDAVATAREAYRNETRIVFSGRTRFLDAVRASGILQRWLGELRTGIDRAMQFRTKGKGDGGNFGLTPTYFFYKVSNWKRTGRENKDGHSLVTAHRMEVGVLPLFLEGPTRMLKTVNSSSAAREIYERVRASPLRDEGLKMYTISANLEGQSFDLGREMAFAPGWLENQSVWLHMSYKFYLEILRHDLFDQFFEEMTSGGILPFMNPEVYGRSLMECSSFIASSAFEDPSLRGRGFLARLSGSTAEFLSMWTLMMLGPKPFYVDETTGELRMQLLPALPRWLFNDKRSPVAPVVSFKLFGAIDVTYYHRRGDDDLFRVPPTRYVIGFRDGSNFEINGPTIPFELADKIRRIVFVASIDAYFEHD